MSRYLNPLEEALTPGEDKGIELRHLEFLLSYGDISVDVFDTLQADRASSIEAIPFNYEKFFNRKGFYKQEELSVSKTGVNEWGIEEVSEDITASIDKWQIIESVVEPASSPKKDSSVLLDTNFRSEVNAELEEVTRC